MMRAPLPIRRRSVATHAPRHRIEPLAFFCLLAFSAPAWASMGQLPLYTEADKKVSPLQEALRDAAQPAPDNLLVAGWLQDNQDELSVASQWADASPNSTQQASDASPVAAPLDSRPTIAVQTPKYELQVLARSLRIYALPLADAEWLAEIPRGQITLADQREGDWFRIRYADGLAEGWVALLPDEYGEMTLSVRELTTARHAPPAVMAADDAIIRRQRPQGGVLQNALPPIDPRQVPPPMPLLPRETLAIPDRWRIMQALGFKFPWYDPYNQNPLKGDLPVLGETLGPDWFFNLGVISDTLYENRRIPTPVAPQTSSRAGSNDIFGRGHQWTFAQNLIMSFGLIKGQMHALMPFFLRIL